MGGGGEKSIFFLSFCGPESVGHSFAYVAYFVFFERCLDSNPESCRSKQSRYQLELEIHIWGYSYLGSSNSRSHRQNISSTPGQDELLAVILLNLTDSYTASKEMLKSADFLT